MKNFDDTQKVATQLLASDKVRIERDRFEEILKVEDHTSNLLVLLSDVDDFIRSVETNPIFEDVRVLISDVGLETAEGPEPDIIIIFKNELPGSVARLNLKWHQVAQIASWDCVDQIEEITTYSIDKEEP